MVLTMPHTIITTFEWIYTITRDYTILLWQHNYRPFYQLDTSFSMFSATLCMLICSETVPLYFYLLCDNVKRYKIILGQSFLYCRYSITHYHTVLTFRGSKVICDKIYFGSNIRFWFVSTVLICCKDAKVQWETLLM